MLFEDNKFRWNGVQEKAKYLRDQVNLIKEENQELRKVITSSFVGGRNVDLDDIELVTGLANYPNKKPKITRSDGGITIQTVVKSGL